MPFKLTKTEIEQRNEHLDNLREKMGKLEDAISEYNGKLEELHGPVEEALSNYNAALDEAKQWCDDVASQADSDFDEKSEKWQEGEKGQAAAAFRDAWQELDLTEIEIEFPGELDVDMPTHADDIENAPEEAEG